MEIEKLKYPIGRFDKNQQYTSENRQKWINAISALPTVLEQHIIPLDDTQLDTPYRPDGWTVRQLVHHIVDSHINSYVRFRWAMTEIKPLIKAYDEKTWAELPDAMAGPVEPSLMLLHGLHHRWVQLLRSMSTDDFARQLTHPEWPKPLTLNVMVALYAWHGEHHVAHISGLIGREGW